MAHDHNAYHCASRLSRPTISSRLREQPAPSQGPTSPTALGDMLAGPTDCDGAPGCDASSVGSGGPWSTWDGASAGDEQDGDKFGGESSSRSNGQSEGSPPPSPPSPRRRVQRRGRVRRFGDVIHFGTAVDVVSKAAQDGEPVHFINSILWDDGGTSEMWEKALSTAARRSSLFKATYGRLSPDQLAIPPRPQSAGAE